MHVLLRDRREFIVPRAWTCVVLPLLLVGPPGCRDYPSQDAMLSEAQECPPGTTRRIEPWGAGKGWLRACVKYDGPWVVWGAKGKLIEGQYIDNHRVGRWTYYDDNGNARSVETYVDGGVVEGGLSGR